MISIPTFNLARTGWAAIAAIITSLVATPIAMASLPEIIVTADYREANEMDTASSITVLTEEVIKSRSAQHFEDLIHSIPNLNFASGSNRARFFQIRGIGERSQFGDPLNSSVGLLIDNIDFSGAGTVATMMDVQQVEVLRGPQGTRYGANALAGLINIKTHDPEDKFSANFKVGAAEYGTKTIGGMITGPLSDTVQFRIAAENHSSDGYYENDFLNKDDTNNRDELTIRTKLNIQPNDNWSLKFIAAHVDIDNGYDAFSLDNNRHTYSDEPGHDRQESTSIGVESTWHLDRFDLVGILNAADSDIEYGFDEDWTFTGFHPLGFTSTDNYIRDRRTSSMEVRFISNESSRIFGGSTDWVAGAYLLSSKEDLLREYTFLESDFTSNYDFNTYAIFFQLDSSLTENIILSSGLRFERRDTTYDNSDAVKFKPRDNLWGGRLALKYFTNENTMTYASISRGYKAGGFNTDGSLDPDLREFDGEYLIEYELGVKSKWLDNRLHLRATLFYDDRRNQQVKSSIVRTRPDGSAEFIDFIGNAAEGTNKGLEIELDWYATEKLKISAGIGLLDAEFDEFINEFGEDLSGREQAHAPSYTANLAVAYRQDNWLFQVSIDSKDDFFFSDRHDVKSDPYVLLNANVGYETELWKISIWGRNLTDKDYFTRAFGSFGNDPRKNFITEPYFQFGEPRIVGVTLEVSL